MAGQHLENVPGSEYQKTFEIEHDLANAPGACTGNTTRIVELERCMNAPTVPLGDELATRAEVNVRS